MRKAIHRFDDYMTALIQGWPKWLHHPLLAVTNVGQPTTVILFIVGLIIWAAWRNMNQLETAGFIILATIVISTVVKQVMRRARPINEYVKKMLIHTYSFPSGHAASATAGFGFLAYLIAVTFPQPWASLLAAFLVVFTLLVCVSRVYLGAHYPTDVVGGMVFGIIGFGLAVAVMT